MDLGLLHILVGSVIFGAALETTPDADGWVLVERPVSYAEEFPDEEKGIWVVLSKEMEGEKFFVRFPDDPSYRYHPRGMRFEIENEKDRLLLDVEHHFGAEAESLFEEKIEKIKALPKAILLKAKKNPNGHECDLFYSFEGKWVFEKMVASSRLLYTFHTESPDMSGACHRQFSSSLELFS